jgi:phage portal protein BeeE
MQRASELPVPRPLRDGFLVNIGASNLELRPVNSKSDQLDSYTGWVYACCSTIAQDLRSNPWSIWLKKGDRREEWQAVPIAKLPSLFQRPNSLQTWGQLIELRNLHKDICGEAYWHLITAKPGGQILGIQMIQPDWVEWPVFDPTQTKVVAWKVSVPQRGSLEIDARDIITDFYPNPRDQMRGASPVEAFALAHHMDIYLRAYGVKLVRDGANIPQYISTDQELTSEQADAAEDRLSIKYRTPGRIGVFGKGTKVETPGLPFRDLAFLQTLKPSQQQIMGIYKVPASKLGIVEDSNRANMEAAGRNYSENALLPRLRTFDEFMNGVILPRVFPNAAELFYESESPVDEDLQFVVDTALKKFAAGLKTVNQTLNEIGDEDQGPDGDVFFIPAGVTVTKTLESAKPSPQSPGGGGNPTPEPAATPTPGEKPAAEKPTPEQTAVEETANQVAKSIAAAAAHAFEAASFRNIAALKKQLAEERFLRLEENLEAKAKSKVRAQFSRDLKEMKRLIEEHYDDARAALSQEMRDMAAAGGVDAFDLAFRGWIDQGTKATHDDWLELLRTVISDGTKGGWELFRSEVAGGISFNIFQQKAVEFAARQAAQKISGIQITTERAVRQLVAKGVENGWSLNETTKALSELYDDFKGDRAETIARTETASSVSWGKYQSARESASRLGLALKREWVATHDDRTRDTHRDADGQRIGLDDTYTVGGAHLKQPADPSGPPEEIINCRCTEIFEDVSGSEAD